jgi:hypothetical protein
MITIIPCFKESDRLKIAPFFSFSEASRKGELTASIIETFGKQEASKRILELPFESWSDFGETKIPLSYLPKVPYQVKQIYRNYRQTNGKQ